MVHVTQSSFFQTAKAIAQPATRDDLPDVLADRVSVIMVEQEAQAQAHVMHGQRLQLLQLWEHRVRAAQRSNLLSGDRIEAV
jgi:hypothetical protein